MENTNNYIIRWAKEDDRIGVTETLVEGFYDHYKGVAESKELLRKALFPAIQPERFVIAVDKENQEVVGTVSLSDEKGYPIIVLKKQLRKIFGFIKGTLVARVLRDEYYIPKRFGPNQAQIDNVTVREKARKQGLATAMLAFALKQEGIDYFTLDVIEGNEVVIPLYQSLGFVETGRRKEKGAKMKGFSFRYMMTYRKQ